MRPAPSRERLERSAPSAERLAPLRPTSLETRLASASEEAGAPAALPPVKGPGVYSAALERARAGAAAREGGLSRARPTESGRYRPTRPASAATLTSPRAPPAPPTTPSSTTLLRNVLGEDDDGEDDDEFEGGSSTQPMPVTRPVSARPAPADQQGKPEGVPTWDDEDDDDLNMSPPRASDPPPRASDPPPRASQPPPRASQPPPRLPHGPTTAAASEDAVLADDDVEPPAAPQMQTERASGEMPRAVHSRAPMLPEVAPELERALTGEDMPQLAAHRDSADDEVDAWASAAARSRATAATARSATAGHRGRLHTAAADDDEEADEMELAPADALDVAEDGAVGDERRRAGSRRPKRGSKRSSSKAERRARRQLAEESLASRKKPGVHASPLVTTPYPVCFT